MTKELEALEKALENWVEEVLFNKPVQLSDGTPHMGKFEAEELFRRARAYFQVRKTHPHTTKKIVDIVAGKRLFTKDGRRVGNAIVVGDSGKSYEGCIIWDVETDFGNTMRLTKSEMEELYHLDWEMEPGVHEPGVEAWRTDRLALLKKLNDAQ